MLDIKLFRESPDNIKADLAKRGWAQEDITKVDEVISLDSKWRDMIKKGDELKGQRNSAARAISVAKKSGQDASEQIAGMRDINAQIEQYDEDIEVALQNRDALRMTLPNLMDDTVPVGDSSDDNVPLRHWGEKRDFGFELKGHQEIIKDLDQGDFDQSRKTSGAGFFYLYDGMVLLDLALMRFAMDHLMKKDFRLVEPPYMLTREAMEGVIDLSDFENVVYKIDQEDLYLIATSEHPLASLHMDQILREKDLPIKYCGISPCFRKEIGAHGIDTRGLFRCHQFNKLEQFVFCSPEDSTEEMEKLIQNAEELYQMLGLPYRVTNICTGDLGGTASKKYDIEAWMPKQGEYKEVVSCSNCTDYQARKLKIRIERPSGDREVLHTLNSTAIATSRTLVAILENYQQEDGTVIIPEVLRPYMSGIERLEKR